MRVSAKNGDSEAGEGILGARGGFVRDLRVFAAFASGSGCCADGVFSNDRFPMTNGRAGIAKCCRRSIGVRHEREVRKKFCGNL